MAIYHLSASIVKRSAGRSVTAAAAYRAAAKIEDITTGLVHDYTRKKGVDYSEILSPISASLGNEWLTDRQELWNKIEEVERRVDAQLAREITLAIPRELSRPEQIALVREYVQTNYVAAGMVADVNLHHLDGDNPHAHILLTMRNLQTTPKGIVEFGLKNTDWNSKDLLLTHRKSWEEITNKYLANYGSDLKIDCRSLKEQGSEFIPQIHVGVHAMAMHRKGKQTDHRDEFERIQAANDDIRTQLERAYQKESTEPELEVKQELTEQQQQQIAADRKLAELIIQVMSPNLKETQTFGIYAIKPCDNKFQVRINHNVILNLKLEDDIWVKYIRYPIKGEKRKHHYSHSDIDTRVDDFVKTIENHRQKIDELKIEAEAEKQRAEAKTQARQAERQRAEAEARIREIDNKRAKAEAKILEIEERRLAREQLKIEIKQREIEEHQARLTSQRLIIEKRKLAEDENRHKNDELGRSLDILLKKWGQRVFFPEDIELTFYRYRHDQISVYTPENSQRISTRVYSLKFIDDSWVDVLKEDKYKYSTDTLTKLVNNQHNRFDTGEIKNLELNYRELKQIPDFKAWRGLELQDHRLTEIREKSVEIITTDLAKYLAEWIKERIPETDYILTENEIHEIMEDSSNSIILINENRQSSVYTSYILLDAKENKSLKIRYNRDRFEDIYGVITPAISERIKDIINDSEPIVQKQELIALEVTDSTPEVITPLSDEKIVVTIPDLPIIKLDSINSTPEVITPLPDKKMIKQQTKRKPSRGFER
jgi:MobA/MobL family